MIAGLRSQSARCHAAASALNQGVDRIVQEGVGSNREAPGRSVDVRGLERVAARHRFTSPSEYRSPGDRVRSCRPPAWTIPRMSSLVVESFNRFLALL